MNRDFMCITTKGYEPFSSEESATASPADLLITEEDVKPDACWAKIISQTAEQNVFYEGNATACISNLPLDLREALIQLMDKEFGTSPINCHIQFANDETFNSVFGWIMVISMFISMLCLLLTVVVYAIKKELSSIPGLNLACLCISHFIHYLTGVLNMFNLPSHFVLPAGCILFGFTRHFSILATFFWLNIMSYDIWKTITGVQDTVKGNSKKVFKWNQFLKYSVYAWGMPLVIAGIAVIVDTVDGVPEKLRPMYGPPSVTDPDLRCTMTVNNLEGFFLFNIGIRICIIFANIVFFVLTAKEIHTIRKHANGFRTTRIKAKNRFRLYLKLFLVMGLAWLLNIVDFIIYARLGVDWIHSRPRWFNVITTFFTIFIGIGIYLTFALIPTISLITLHCKKPLKKHESQETQFESFPTSSVAIKPGTNSYNNSAFLNDQQVVSTKL